MATVALLVVVLGSLLLVALGLLSLFDRLPPNSVAGIRTPYTFSSPENWYRTHRAAAPVLIWGGVAGAMAGLAFLPFAVAGKVSPGAVGGVTIAIAALILVAAIGSWLYGVNRAKRAGA